MTESGDSGEAPPELAEALAAWALRPDAASRHRVYAALLASRLLVGVVPVVAGGPARGPRSRGERRTEMALGTLVGRDGRLALPAFTSVTALRRWRPEARPVVVPPGVAFASALTEGHAAVVVDVAGPVAFTVADDELAELAAGRVPEADDPLAGAVVAGGLSTVAAAPDADPQLLRLLQSALAEEPLVAEAFLLAPERGPDVSDVAVGLVLTSPVGAAQLVALVRRLAGVIGPSPAVRAGLDIAVLSAEQRAQASRLGPPVYRAGGVRAES